MTMTSKPLAPAMLLAAALMTAIVPDTVLLAAAYNAIATAYSTQGERGVAFVLKGTHASSSRD
jgi:hypothetical protein